MYFSLVGGGEGWTRKRPLGQSHLGQKDFEQVVIVPSGQLALGAYAELVRGFLPQQVKGDVSQHGKVFRPVSLAHAGIILAEGDIQDPMELVFDLPVSSHRLKQLLGVTLQAGDEVASLHRPGGANATFCLDHGNGTQPLPVPQGGNVLQVLRGRTRPTLANLNTAMSFLHRPGIVTLHPFHLLLIIKEVLNRFQQSPLILLHSKHVISTIGDDSLHNRLLAAHRIRGHHTS